MFIVLEGLDGSGTTTQTRIISKALQMQGLKVCTTNEPSSGPIGSLIRQVLSSRLVSRGGFSLSTDTMALLFAADRIDHCENIIAPALGRGEIVVCDRYVYSSLVYQVVTSTWGNEDWLKIINQQAIIPNLTLILDATPETCFKRRKDRNSKEIYEVSHLQENLYQAYRNLSFPEHNLVHINGDRTKKQVFENCMQVIKKHLDNH
jgi:dTMP kinase